MSVVESRQLAKLAACSSSHSRVFQHFDASGDDRGVRYHYNPRGYLEKLQEAREGVEGVVYQLINAMDPRGNVTAMTLGNGVVAFADYHDDSGRLNTLTAYDKNNLLLQDVRYSFDVAGNLLSRRDESGANDLEETFQYDGLNRLEEVLFSINDDAPATTLSLDTDLGSDRPGPA